MKTIREIEELANKENEVKIDSVWGNVEYECSEEFKKGFVKGYRKGEQSEILDFEKFYDETVEDWHLWDESTRGEYPVNRILDAMKNFIKSKK